MTVPVTRTEIRSTVFMILLTIILLVCIKYVLPYYVSAASLFIDLPCWYYGTLDSFEVLHLAKKWPCRDGGKQIASKGEQAANGHDENALCLLCACLYG